MSIANELSSEVATFLLARNDKPRELLTKTLTEIVLEVHSTLCRLKADVRQNRRSQPSLTPPQTDNSSIAASGSH